MSYLGRNNSSMNTNSKGPAFQDSDYEDSIEYDHPEVPEEIKFRGRSIRRRIDIFAKMIDINKIENEKELRCKLFEQGFYGDYPVTFQENTNKEKLILEHVKKYEAQFKIAYKAEDRQFLLCPPNECGIRKFICTTLRPTKLGYIEFYKYKICADYIANFILYEPLENPLIYPRVIPSPTSTILWQKGDCVDMSILLTSLLIGVGYDAFCVLGTAPREVTLKNESLMDNPYEEEGLEFLQEKNERKEAEEVNKYEPEPRRALISKHDQMVIKENIRKAEEEKFRNNDILDDDEPDRLPDDPFMGMRVHCWVLLKKGPRGVDHDLFIEPSTGRAWKVDDKSSPYLKCTQVFNNKNFWVNLKPNRPLNELDFNNMNNGERTEWEYVMLDTVDFPSLHGNDDELYNDEDEYGNPKLLEVQNVIKEISHLIDMPLPWAPKLYIDKDKFLKGSPLGEVTRFYKKSRVDFFTKYSQIDGLVKRITFYNDYKRTLVREVRCIYKHRRNNLIMTRRFPYQFQTIEYYSPNNKPLEPNDKWPHWKSIDEIDRQQRIIKFYPYRHDDGLIERREYIWREPEPGSNKRKMARGAYNKTVDIFEGRDDFLEYRSFLYIQNSDSKEANDFYTFTSAHLDNSSIIRMTQKFGKNRFKPAKEQVQSMTIDLDPTKNRITIFYHLEEGEIAPIVKTYKRSDLNGVPTMPDGTDQGDQEPEDQLRKQQIYNMEKDCYNQIKTAEAKNRDELKTYRKDVEEDINKQKIARNDDVFKKILQKTLHDRAREKYKDDLKRREEEAEAETFENDILAPFLDENTDSTKVFSAQQAQKIKTDVMVKFKERIITRADIIEKRIKYEDSELKKKQELQKKNTGEPGKTGGNTMDDDIMTLQTRIKILRNRATRFQKNALNKYQELQIKLENDPRLVNASSKKNNY